MIKRVLGLLVLMTLGVSLIAVLPGSAGAGAQQYRPDAWIKLCGLSNGCKINPPPHPWRGRNVYNTTGSRQSVSVRMEDGEGVRFWLAIESDGTEADTIYINGCNGTRRFRVNKVQIGLYKNPNAGAVKITEKFKAGTANFDFPAGTDKIVYLTLNIIAPTTAEGVTYRCPITIHSDNQPIMKDTLRATMTTY